DIVLKCIQLFLKGTSCGRDGLRVQHLLDAMCGEGSPVARDLLDGGIRLMTVCTIWRGLVTKVAMKEDGKDVAKYLNNFQFGVLISGGAEAVLHSANMV
ncbi:hypothetical protein A2U01_0053480, partial [Trifolium medium]|nr:hypothetical protein [Trifolium medium]